MGGDINRPPSEDCDTQLTTYNSFALKVSWVEMNYVRRASQRPEMIAARRPLDARLLGARIVQRLCR